MAASRTSISPTIATNPRAQPATQSAYTLSPVGYATGLTISSASATSPTATNSRRG